MLIGNILLGASELEVEVAVRADQAALVFRLVPLEADNDILVDELLKHRSWVHWYERHVVRLCGGKMVGVFGIWVVMLLSPTISFLGGLARLVELESAFTVARLQQDPSFAGVEPVEI